MKRWRFDPAPLVEKRRALRLTHSAFGRKLRHPMSSGQMKEIETKRRAPRVDTLVRICNEIGLAPTDFFRRGR